MNLRARAGGAAGLAFLLVAAGVGGAPATAAPSPGRPVAVRCGDVLTKDTVLAADVGPCSGDGIVIGADNITLQMSGRRVFGAPGPDDNVGIRIPKHAGVVVTGGTVSDFGAGIAITGGSGNTVKVVTVEDNIGPLDGSGNFGDGVAIINSTGNVVRDNVVRHNGPFDGVGVFGTPSTGNQILNNRIERNNVARFVPQLGLSLNLDDGVNLGAGLGGGSHTTVARNLIRSNGRHGIIACSDRGEPCISTDDVITGNIVRDNGFGDPDHPDPLTIGDGIHLVGITPPGDDFEDFFPSTRELISGNEVMDNAGNGIVVGSSDNRILNNTSLRNGLSPADFFLDLLDISLNNDCDNNLWSGNTFGTGDPECVGADGRQIGPRPRPQGRSAMAGSPVPVGVGRGGSPG